MADREKDGDVQRENRTRDRGVKKGKKNTSEGGVKSKNKVLRK